MQTRFSFPCGDFLVYAGEATENFEEIRENDMETPVTKAKVKRGRPRNPNPNVPVQLRIPPEFAQRMKAHARELGLPLAAWIRLTCVRELKKLS